MCRAVHPDGAQPEARGLGGHAFEVRHPSFDDPAFVRLLREENVAMCVAAFIAALGNLLWLMSLRDRR